VAMSVGGEANPTQVRRSHWEALARSLGIGPRLVLATVRALAEALPEAATLAEKDFLEKHGHSPALEAVLPKVRRQAKRVLHLLA